MTICKGAPLQHICNIFSAGNCQDEGGGFAGGPGQQAHLAPTYAAVNALCILGTEEAYSIINRKTLQVCSLQYINFWLEVLGILNCVHLRFDNPN